jgi:hypothetical protein
MGTITATVTEGATVATGVVLDPSTLNSIAKPTVTITTPISVANGGTNSTSASAARTALGLGTISTQASNSVSITGGSISGITDLPVADGGTGASSASSARSNLGCGTIATQAADSIAVTGGTMSGVVITLPSYATSGLPTAGTAGRLVYVTDGDGGDKCLGFDDGSAWKRIALGATVSAT